MKLVQTLCKQQGSSLVLSGFRISETKHCDVGEFLHFHTISCCFFFNPTILFVYTF